ncbi:MAG TPA: FtsX-like permease family protein [Thermoguttaceae bacterium]|nr:FtsX-like permease family protein [Thermoguttaceae bacterium]
MTTLKLLLAEIGYRKLNFALSLLAVTVAVSLLVAGPVVIGGYGRETDAKLAELEDQTRNLMKDMGFNLMIVHRDTNMSDFWANDFAKETMPQEYVERLADDDRLTKVTHLVATLQQRITWNGRQALLVGYLPETPKPYKPQTKFAARMAEQERSKLPMGEDITPGTVRLGHELAKEKKVGETVDLLGETFTIDRIDPEKGSKEDITIKVHLSDAQRLLGLPGKINQIFALECQCRAGDLPIIREQLESVLPEAQVTEFQSIAVARALQREEVKINRQSEQARAETLATVITPLVVLAAAVWVGLLMLANVRERRCEIGILRALGKRSGTIAALFLGKAVLLGLAGAVVGFLLGTAIGYALGTEALGWVGAAPVYGAADFFSFPYYMLLIALVGAPMVSAAASYLPTLAALRQDPAVVLRDL